MIKRICGNCIYWSQKHTEHKKCKACGENNRLDRPNFMPRDMHCPICEAPMIYYDFEYLECPDCGTQLWPFENQPDGKKVIREEFEKQLPAMRNKTTSSGLITVHSKLNGGSKNSRKKKQPAKKKSTTQIYNEMAAQPNKIKL